MRCRQESMTVGRIYIDQRKIDINPVYQREAGVWSTEKKQLFIDSLLNGFDIPKLYFNELEPGLPFDYAVIDGKQRVSTIISFMTNEFSLSSDFSYSGEELDVSESPRPNQLYSDFSERAQEIFKGVSLAVTTIYNSSDDDIENLFARLNNGEPLNSAESRNAIGGDMAALIREIADRNFFKRKVKFSNNRYAHREVACKLLYMEWQRVMSNVQGCPDLKKKHLDEFVSRNKELTEADRTKLVQAIDKRLKDMEKCFIDNSPELSKQSYPQFFFLTLRHLQNQYTHHNLLGLVKDYLPFFTLARAENNEKPEENRDPTLVEFGRLTQQGTNDSGSMTRRSEILIRYFLIANPDVSFKDTRRAFNDSERYAIWIRADKKCQVCSTNLATLEDVDADHEMRFVDGGETSLKNARCLCINCNRRGAN
jgi:hypothetical protein